VYPAFIISRDHDETVYMVADLGWEGEEEMGIRCRRLVLFCVDPGSPDVGDKVAIAA
jgi:hypothetical protein